MPRKGTGQVGPGRPKGSKNKGRRVERKIPSDSELSAILKKRETPLEYLVSVYTDKNQPTAIRIEAAKSCLPYFHKRQPQIVQQTGDEKSPLLFRIIYSGPEDDAGE